MVGFYNRFKNKNTPKVESAMKLWGGRKYLSKLKTFYKRYISK